MQDLLVRFKSSKFKLQILNLTKIKFSEGRQYGRGKTGGQVRDEYRTDYDPGRGGYGKRNEDHQMRKRLILTADLSF